MKRLFDIFFSLVALAIFAAPGLLIAVLLLFRERHPVFFHQKRIGKNKHEFTILKFQTMVDEQVTPLGRILRKTGIDEWAQFFNVLKGDMSIVGPRALTQYDIERLHWNDDFHATRWQVKPGISGLAQLYGGQHRKISWFWDLRYIRRNNVFMDFCIIVSSFMMNIFGKTKIRRILFKNNNLK
ncbi:MAG: sugar transferase [Tannerella sp.]|jgi:lipopolysaccharide/colanic/teichoic acid biosynthesis glycosyltransferase|nr:sugar transferase [Tannerella sp.]